MSSSKYIPQALAIFREEGLKLSMDELASRIGVTKKTLYNNFESKDVLIEQCVKDFMDSFSDRISVLTSPGLNAVAALRKGILELKDFFGSFSPMFLSDLKKLYPEMAGMGHRSGFGMFVSKVRENILKGKSEGLYRDSLDEDLMSKYISFSVFTYFVGNVMRNPEVSAKDYFDNVIDFTLRGMASSKGQESL